MVLNGEYLRQPSPAAKNRLLVFAMTPWAEPAYDSGPAPIASAGTIDGDWRHRKTGLQGRQFHTSWHDSTFDSSIAAKPRLKRKIAAVATPKVGTLKRVSSTNGRSLLRHRARNEDDPR